MSLKKTINMLAAVADELDSLGMIHEANVLTNVMIRTAQFMGGGDPNHSEWHKGEDDDDGWDQITPDHEEYYNEGLDGNVEGGDDLDSFRNYLNGLVQDVDSESESKHPLKSAF